MSKKSHEIEKARRRIQDFVHRTPCPPMATIYGPVFVKLDCLQATGSFKVRGAANALLKLSKAARARGVITASAGNHGQALAYVGKKLGIPVTVVVPNEASVTKVNGCRNYGAQVLYGGVNIAECKEFALGLSADDGSAFISPYDHEDVVEGQGTVALELLEQLGRFDVIIVPVGGGGLLAGICAVLAANAPHVHIIGVEPLNKVSGTVADSLSIPEIGQVPQQYLGNVATWLQVSEEEIERAMRDMARNWWLVEGAGAVALAGFNKLNLVGRRVVLLATGRNIDEAVLDRVVHVTSM